MSEQQAVDDMWAAFEPGPSEVDEEASLDSLAALQREEMARQPELFGPHDPFIPAATKYGMMPTTVWPLDHQDRYEKELRRAVGDDGEARRNVLHGDKPPGSLYDVHASIFSPALAQWIVNMYSQPGDLVFDPFAGGGTRAIMAAKSGRQYLGIELRQEEVEATLARVAKAGAEGVTVLEGDAMNAAELVGVAKADFLYTCPPYWNLERYGGGAFDLSEMTWPRFEAALFRVACEAWTILKPGARAVWVTGLHRHAGTGALAHIPRAVAQAHEAAGFDYMDEAILHHRNNGAVQRVGNFEKGKRLLVRTHEYVQVFKRNSEPVARATTQGGQGDAQ